MALLQIKVIQIYVEIICGYFAQNGDDVHYVTYCSYESCCFGSYEKKVQCNVAKLLHRRVKVI